MSKLQKYLKIENTAKELEYDTHGLTSNSLAVPIEDILSLGEIDHLSDVTLNAVASNHMLVYNNTSTKWENKVGGDVISALGITASLAELNILDISTASNANNTTNFLRADGTWAAPTSSGITGLSADSSTKQLNVAEDYKFVFEGLTSNNFETTLQVEDPTADRVITLPDDFGEVSLSPIYTTWYYKNITKTSPFIFSKNNESVMLTGGISQYQGSDDFYVILPDWNNLTSSTSLNDTSLYNWDPTKGIRYKLARSSAGKVFIAPGLSGDDIEVIGNSSWDASNNNNRVVLFSNIVQGKTYKIISGSGWSNLGATNDSSTTFFTASQNGNSSGSGSAFECLEISAADFKAGWLDIVGIKQKSSSNYYYAISQPSQLLDSPTVTGTATFSTAEADNLLAKQSVKIQESGGTDTINLKAPALAASYDLTLPNSDGNAANRIMKTTDANGSLDWVTILDEDDFTSNSGVDVPTQRSVKNYIQNQMLSIQATSSGANSYEMTYASPTVSLILSDVNSTPLITIKDITTPYALADGSIMTAQQQMGALYNQMSSLHSASRRIPTSNQRYKIYLPPVDSSLLGSKIQLKIVVGSTGLSGYQALRRHRYIIMTNPNDAKAGENGSTTYSSSVPNAVFIESGAHHSLNGSISHYDEFNYYTQILLSTFTYNTRFHTFELFRDEDLVGPDGTVIDAYIWKLVN